MASPVRQSMTTEPNGLYILSSVYRLSQSFTPTNSHALDQVDVRVGRDTGDSPGTITMNIKAADGSGHPTGAALGTATVDADLWDAVVNPTDTVWETFTFSPAISLTAGTKYTIEIISAATAGQDAR